MVINGSLLNSSSPDPSDTVLYRPPWVTTTLGCFLIFTIVVDILGNLLVIFSVYRNKKLRNAGERKAKNLFFVRVCALARAVLGWEILKKNNKQTVKVI